VKEILADGTDCSLVESGDAAGFTDRVCELIDEPGRIARYTGASLRKVRSRFSAEAMTRSVESIYLRHLPERA